MTRVRVRVLPGSMASESRLLYVASDYTLRYTHEPFVRGDDATLAMRIENVLRVRRPQRLFVSIGTLTCQFDGPEMELVGVDAYTNFRIWECTKSVVVPSEVSTGRAVFAGEAAWSGPEDSDYIEYTYSDESGILEVRFGEGQALRTAVRLSKHLVVGVGAAQDLCSLWLEGLHL